jgi:hypothetical protein
MRTVLPDATSVRFGEVTFPSDDANDASGRRTVFYYIMPHVAWWRTHQTDNTGLPLMGQYMRVVNVVDDHQFQSTGEGFFRLREYAPSVKLDEDVVYEGNAACYFDISHGDVYTIGEGKGARQTCVTMRTHGTPIVHMARLPGAYPQAITGDYPIYSNELFITNLDLDPACEYANFDFLMNYLVVKGGIPKVLAKRTPGLTSDSSSATLHRMGVRLKALGEAVNTLGTVEGYLKSGTINAPKCVPPLPADAPSPFQMSVDGSDSVRFPIQDPVPFDQSCSPSSWP